MNFSAHDEKNIVFDLDGTLIDSAPDIQFIAATVLARRECAELSLAETRSFIGEGSAVFVRRMMQQRDIDETQFNAIHEEFLALYESSVDKALFYPGVEDVLASLRATGFQLGICTNKPAHATRAVLQHMGLHETIDTVVAGGMVTNRKPSPDMLLRTIAALGGGPTLYVGDSEIDAETAQRAGVPFALFSQGYRKQPVECIAHNWVFDDFNVLPDIVQRWQRELPAQSVQQ